MGESASDSFMNRSLSVAKVFESRPSPPPFFAEPAPLAPFDVCPMAASESSRQSKEMRRNIAESLQAGTDEYTSRAGPRTSPQYPPGRKKALAEARAVKGERRWKTYCSAAINSRMRKRA